MERGISNKLIYLRSQGFYHPGQELPGIILNTSKIYKEVLKDLYYIMWGEDYPHFMQWNIDHKKITFRTLTKEEWHKARKAYGEYEIEMMIDRDLSMGSNEYEKY
jgi:hypothetical protein